MTEEQHRKPQAAKDYVIAFYWNVAKMYPSLLACGNAASERVGHHY
jgi:hypothetical protein